VSPFFTTLATIDLVAWFCFLPTVCFSSFELVLSCQTHDVFSPSSEALLMFVCCILFWPGKENDSLNTSFNSGSSPQPHPSHIPYNPHKHIHSKPPYSFSCLIFMAIEDSSDHKLPVKVSLSANRI